MAIIIVSLRTVIDFQLKILSVELLLYGLAFMVQYWLYNRTTQVAINVQSLSYSRTVLNSQLMQLESQDLRADPAASLL